MQKKFMHFITSRFDHSSFLWVGCPEITEQPPADLKCCREFWWREAGETIFLQSKLLIIAFLWNPGQNFKSFSFAQNPLILKKKKTTSFSDCRLTCVSKRGAEDVRKRVIELVNLCGTMYTKPPLKSMDSSSTQSDNRFVYKSNFIHIFFPYLDALLSIDHSKSNVCVYGVLYNLNNAVQEKDSCQQAVSWRTHG